jgi:polynucleotide 5'-hydroxyl-kinase GRC3/NOL9
MNSDVEILPGWVRAAETVLARRGVVAVLGASDTGKTTFCRILVEHGRATERTAGLVDGDIGQSSIGPPGIVGLAVFPPNHPSTPHPSPLTMDCVGSTSPPGHYLPHIRGTQNLVAIAMLRGAEIVVVDTTGMISGGMAASLKRRKLQAIGARYVLALQREGELESILYLIAAQPDLKIHRLPVLSKVLRRSHKARRAYREGRFQEYFASAAPHVLQWEGLRVNPGRRVDRKELTALSVPLQTMPLYAEVSGQEGMVFVRGPINRAALVGVGIVLQAMNARVIDVEQIRGTVLGLHEQKGTFLALGILQDFDPGRGQLEILTPLQAPRRIRGVAFGSFRLEATGQQLGAVSWR